MITLRVNPYSKEEIAVLAQILGHMETVLMRECSPSTRNGYITDCKECEYRHLCYDISSAKEHAEKLARRVKNEIYR